jgi:hypothetical protein
MCGCEDETVATLLELFFEKPLHLIANDPAFRMPQDQARSVVIGDREKIQLASQASMIATFGFFALLEPRVELVLLRECDPVDALHLLIVRIAFPVRTGDREKLECLKLTRVRNVRPETEIDELRIVDVVDARRVGNLLIDQLALERLFALFEDVEDLCFLDDLATIGKILFRHRLHLFLDERQIFFRQIFGAMMS